MHRFVIPVLLLLTIVGCSLRNETTNYYYNPAFTRDGKVLFVTERHSSDKDALGSQVASSNAEYLTTIYPAGTGESTSLLDVTDLTPGPLNCSPTGEYVGFLYELRSGAYGKLGIYSISAEAGPWFAERTVTFPLRIKSFDWSASAEKVIYCTTSEVRVKDLGSSEDLLITAETGIESVGLKYGMRIVAAGSSEGIRRCFSILLNGTGRVDYVAALEQPQINGGNTGEAFGILDGKLVKINLTSGVTTEIYASFSNIDNFSLSPDGTLAAFSRTNETTGVYVLNLATGSVEAVK